MSVQDAGLSCQTRPNILVGAPSLDIREHELSEPIDHMHARLCTRSEEAMRIAGIPEPSKHYFVDDSALNVKGAKKLGWNSYLFDEDGSAQVQPGQVDASINSLQGD